MASNLYIFVASLALFCALCFAEDLEVSDSPYPIPAVAGRYEGWVQMPKDQMETQFELPLDGISTYARGKASHFKAQASAEILSHVVRWEIKYSEVCNAQDQDDCIGTANGTPYDTLGNPLCIKISGNYTQLGKAVDFQSLNVFETSNCEPMLSTPRKKTASLTVGTRLKKALEADWSTVITDPVDSPP